ncbi:MAG TPA: AmmeMemoRadiSam system protein B [Actinomycetota bacterium]
MSAPRVRPAAAAGTFYPQDPKALTATVDALMEAATPPEDAWEPKGLIVPHAGYRYSGPVAASAYSLLARIPVLPVRVAVLGPAHFVGIPGASVPRAAAWATPLGEVPIDPKLREAAVAAGAIVDDGPHGPEHAVEVQLPFLQRIVGPSLSVLPVAVGHADPVRTAALIGALAEVPGTLVMASTDLSHYHTQREARVLDARTAEAAVRRDSDAIGPEDACGVHALRGMVEHARGRGLAIRLLDLRTSADTGGDPLRVVGYGAFALA